MDDGADIVVRGFKLFFRMVLECSGQALEVFDWVGRMVLKYVFRVKKEVSFWKAVPVGICAVGLFCITTALLAM
jgi:hypothetical protein